MKEIPEMSVRGLAQVIRAGEISSVEVTEAFLRRIREVNPKLNAVVQVCADAALSEAARADRALAKGECFGPLHGVPMTLKDSFDSAGVVSAGGTLGRKDFVPVKDATVLSRLRKNGAILLGKTNTPEFTLMYETDNLGYGRTNNPYDLECSPGGSSGGAAAIVASGGSPFDVGSDYGGSLRYPAHCCGITSIKPTSGRVPRTGHILPFGGVLDSFQQVGPVAKRVEDLEYILPLITGPDWIDPSIVPMPLGESKNVDIRTMRVAFHTDNGLHPASEETVLAVHAAAKALEAAGALVEEVRRRVSKTRTDHDGAAVRRRRGLHTEAAAESGTERHLHSVARTWVSHGKCGFRRAGHGMVRLPQLHAFVS